MSSHRLLCTTDFSIWNERNYDADWVVRFRSALDDRGHHHVEIVAADTNWVCDNFVNNKTLLDAIGVFGAHYPITSRKHSDIPASCAALGKPLWTSEGWSLGEVNDYKGTFWCFQPIPCAW